MYRLFIWLLLPRKVKASVPVPPPPESRQEKMLRQIKMLERAESAWEVRILPDGYAANIPSALD